MDDKFAQSTSLAVLKVIPELLETGTVAVVVTIIDSTDLIGAKLLLDERGNTAGTFGSRQLDGLVISRARTFLESREDVRALRGKEFSAHAHADSLFLFERIQPEAHIVICGAGHVGAALANLAALASYRVTVIDDRQEFLQPEQFRDGDITPVLAVSWADAVRTAVGNGKGVSIAIVTRGHNEDEQCLRAAVETDADYIGLIGSKRRTTIVINRLRESGAPEASLEKIHAPIGLDIGAVTPEEVAVAILAEIICVRRGGTGGLLSVNRSRR